MTDDVRISVGLPGHPKTKKLKRRIGAEGCWSLIVLFLWVGSERWDGSLSGMTDEDIELAAGWDGPPDAFVMAMIEVGFLKGNVGARFINGWQEHNPFAAGKGGRIERGKAGAAARWGKLADATGIAQAEVKHANSDFKQCPPTPTPTKSELLCIGQADAPPKADPIPYTAIVDLYNSSLTALPKVRELTPKRRTLIRSAWQAAPSRRSLKFWGAYFAECQDDGFLNGAGPYGSGHTGWRPDFEFLMREATIVKTYERALDRRDRAGAGT